MQRSEGLAALTSTLAALSVHPQSTTTSSTTATRTHFKPPTHYHSPHSVASHPYTPPAAPPAPILLPTFPPLPPSTTVRDCLRHFLSVQEQRALTYSAWQASFRHYLSTKREADLHAFTSHCQQATTAFQQLSLQVKLCVAQLQVAASSEWAEQLQAVQRLEREKLELTVGMQEVSSEWLVVRKEEFSSELQEQMSVRRRRMDEVVEAINDILTEVKYEVRYKKQQ